MSTSAPRPAPLGFKIGLAVVAMLFAFGLCELGARMIYPAPPDPTRVPQLPYLSDPEIRYVLRPNDRGWIDDGFVTINSLGFRGHETETPKPQGRYRIVTIGDSLTLGWGVNDDETYSARLEQLAQAAVPHRDVDVVNLGVGGYNTRQEVTLLKRNVARLEPDLVLVGFYTNDVPDGLEDDRSRSAGGTPVAVADPQAGRVLHMNVTSISWWENAIRQSRAGYLLGKTVKRVVNKDETASARFAMELNLLEGTDSPELDEAWAGVEKQLQELRTLSQSSHFAVGIVVLPCREQVLGQFANARYQTRVREIADRLGFFVIDPLPALAAVQTDKDVLFIPYDRNHPSAEGHAMIGRSIFSYLEEHRLIPSGLPPAGRMN